MSEYLFPIPGSVLRGLLDRKAQAGEQFSEKEAIADVMLDLDINRIQKPRDYQKRWQWKSHVTIWRRLEELTEEAQKWRSFYKSDVKQRETRVKQRETNNAENDPKKAGRETRVKQRETRVKQADLIYTRATDTELQITNTLSKELKQPEDGETRAREQVAAADLSFLTEKDAVYEPSIRDFLKQFPPSSIDLAFIQILKGDHRRTNPLASILALQKKYGHAKLIAALVVAGSENKGGASLKFVEGIMKRWESSRPAPSKNGSAARSTYTPAGPDFSFLDAPITD